MQRLVKKFILEKKCIFLCKVTSLTILFTHITLHNTYEVVQKKLGRLGLLFFILG